MLAAERKQDSGLGWLLSESVEIRRTRQRAVSHRRVSGGTGDVAGSSLKPRSAHADVTEADRSSLRCRAEEGSVSQPFDLAIVAHCVDVNP
jgi:hypothetical protein